MVGGPISGLEGYATRDYTDVNRYWEGVAAEAYLDALPVQRQAIAHMTAIYSQPASTSLDALASAIEEAWIIVVAGLVLLVVGLIAALKASTTIVGIPLGVLAAVGAFLTFVAAMITAYLRLRSAAASQNTFLQEKLHDNTALRGESWPTSTILD